MGAGNVSGIGLSVVSAIVSQCGGTMLTTSDEKSGTTVTVSLPLAEGPDIGELETYVASCDYPVHLVELSDFPAYNAEYNLHKTRAPLAPKSLDMG
jgi:hypothetical protein